SGQIRTSQLRQQQRVVAIIMAAGEVGLRELAREGRWRLLRHTPSQVDQDLQTTIAKRWDDHAAACTLWSLGIELPERQILHRRTPGGLGNGADLVGHRLQLLAFDLPRGRTR